MATITDEKIEIRITPRRDPMGWWEFDFSFWRQGQPRFNPEITKNSIFTGDE